MHAFRIIAYSAIIVLIAGALSCSDVAEEKKLRQFISEHVAKVKPLHRKINRAEYTAAVSGKVADYERAARLNIELSRYYNDKDKYQFLKNLQEDGPIKKPLLKRQLNELLEQFTYYQGDSELIARTINNASDIRMKFSTYRPEVGDTTITNNEVEHILTHSKDHQKLEKVWKASKQVGVLVANDFLRLVKNRNKIAQNLGYKNYFRMKLDLQGHHAEKMDNLLRQLDSLTAAPYRKVKAEIDSLLSAQLNIPKEKLRPWHYQNQFFQTAPDVLNMNLNRFYKGVDMFKLASRFYKSIGLPADDIIARSHLRSKAGKRQHASTFPINRNGEVHIIGNIGNTAYSMNRLLYELGFAMYYRHINDTLPYVLRKPAHFLMSDAIAIMFGDFSYDPVWIHNMTGSSTKSINKQAKHFMKMEKLVFTRWALVMHNFEKGLYKNPNRNLNTFWWDLVEKYQLLHRPKNRDKPDWAAKSHFFTNPCTYHNYIYGELFASHLRHYLNHNVCKPASANPEWSNKQRIGKFLIDNIFSKGALYSYPELIKQVTGESLATEYFQNQYLK